MTAEFFINMSQIFIYKQIGSIVMNLRQSIRNSFYLKPNTVAWKKRARLKKLQCRPHRRLDMRNLYTHINRARKVAYTYLSSYLAFLKSRCDVAKELIATFSKSVPQILGVNYLIHQFVEFGTSNFSSQTLNFSFFNIYVSGIKKRKEAGITLFAFEQLLFS